MNIINYPEQVREPFIKSFCNDASIQMINSQPSIVLGPQLVDLIGHMSKFNYRNKPTTKRWIANADNIHLKGRVGIAKLIGESPIDCFESWFRAIGCGNAGVSFEITGEWVGLRTTKGDNRIFTFYKNPRTYKVSALIFCQVHQQHSGHCYVIPLGWAYRSEIKHLMRDCRDHWKINVNKLEKEGLLLPIESFKESWEAHQHLLREGA